MENYRSVMRCSLNSIFIAISPGRVHHRMIRFIFWPRFSRRLSAERFLKRDVIARALKFFFYILITSRIHFIKYIVIGNLLIRTESIFWHKITPNLCRNEQGTDNNWEYSSRAGSTECHKNTREHPYHKYIFSFLNLVRYGRCTIFVERWLDTQIYKTW